MEDQQSTAEQGLSQPLTPPDAQGQSLEGMQQVNQDGSVANTAVPVSPPPIMAPQKPPNRFDIFLKSCMVGLRKVWILLWKNMLLRGRSYILLIFQILMMGVVLGLTLLSGPPSGSGFPNGETEPENITQGEMISRFLEEQNFGRQKILYAVIDGQMGKVDEIKTKIDDALPSYSRPTWERVSIDDIEKRYGKSFAGGGRGERIAGAVIFERLSETELKYTIRVSDREGLSLISGSPTTDAPFDTGTLFSDSGPGPDESHRRAYNDAGILGLQFLIDDAAIKVLHGTTEAQKGLKREITLKSFPYPPHQTRGSHGHSIWFCTMFILVLVFSNAFLAINIGSEKETGVKELMKLCGYPGWMQWLAWYLIMFLVDIILFILLLLMLAFIPCGYESPALGIYKRPVLENSDFVLCLIMLLLAMISNNAFIICVCSMIKSTSVATAAAILLPVVIIPVVALLIPDTFKALMAISLLPNGCFVVAFRYIFAFEADGHGAKWSLLAEPLPNIPKMNMGYVILMFIVDIVLFQSLAVYLEAILPSDYGVRKPAYFPIQAMIAPIMARRKRKGVPTPSQMTVPPTESKANGFEPDQGHDKMIGVDIRNLVKKFGRVKTAVNGVSLKMYDGEIFALLGHNGAGKTTLISMLSGLFAPTSGTARVGGYDITTDLDKVRQSLGLCPQHDMLFANLTVLEHLKIFGQMKGQSSSMVKQEALGLLNMMQMMDKKDTVSKKLSGGQKRRLCLGMALIGGAKVVILDEPTSGMDPEARRAIWDILLQIRGQRTILLTTHFMEEADVLGDRIGIMAEGKLQCCGSPSYLKSFYGTGYTLKVALLPGADKNAILALVQHSISDASLKPIDMPNEVFIALPTETANPSALSSMFTALTDKKDEMLIESLGLSVASMDEIFVRVGELSGAAAVAVHTQPTKPPKSTESVRTQDPLKKKEDHDFPPDVLESATISQIPTVSQGQGDVGTTRSNIPPSVPPSKSRRRANAGRCCLRFGQAVQPLKKGLLQALAVLIKRFICTIRKIGFLLFQILAPVSFMIGAVIVINEELVTPSLPPPLKIGLSSYKNPKTLFSDELGQIPRWREAIRPAPKYENNVKDALKKAAKSDITFFRENLIAAGEVVSDADYNAWFNTIPLHAAPLAMNLASNIRGMELDPPFKIHMTSHPLKTQAALTIKTAAKIGDRQYKFFGFSLAGFMFAALLLFATFFVVLPTEERLNKSRQLQLMTGMHPLLYWVAYFLWDVVLLLLVATVMISIPAIFGRYQIFSSYGGLGAIFLLILGFGIAIIPLAYLISNLPKSAAGGVTILILFLLVPLIVNVFLMFSRRSDIFQGGLIMSKLVPMSGVVMSFWVTGWTLSDNGKCKLLGKSEYDIICSPMPNPSDELESLWPCCKNCGTLPGGICFKPTPFFLWEVKGKLLVPVPGIGQYLLCFFLYSLVCLALHIILELGVLRLIRSLLTRGINASDFLEQVDDEDVKEEEHRVAEMIMTKNTTSDALVVDTLCKNYGGLSAVSKLTFGVHHGECFGLLGTNGAGKTTSFRMITGDELPSLGDVHGSHLTLKKNRRKLISHIGYCPQFDAFVPYLTGIENLQLFARLRGVPWRQVNREVSKLLENVGLTESGNIQCKKYSGGMKRRLSAAIALIGNPALILLDEPTSGVDPVSRRQFWKVLESVKGHGQSIILTSHSMDECEALCARLGIMVNGQLQCIGGVQHLKHKFAQGYSLTLKLKAITDPQMQQYALGMLGALNNEISQKFHPCMLKDQHETVLQYQIENTALGWNVIYNNLEELKKSYADIIEDYSVSETSLEEVFLAFSRKQYPPRDSKIPLCRRIWTCQY